MGAHDFELIKIGPYKSAQDAFNEATKDALYEHGHDSYNGTISTTHLIKTISAKDAPRPGTKAWETFIAKQLPGKWECVAIEIKRGTYFNRIKERAYGKNIKKNLKAYVFIGLAAC